MIDSKIQRKKELELNKAEKLKDKERDRRRVEKGKGRPKDSSSPVSVAAIPLPSVGTIQRHGDVSKLNEGTMTTSSNDSTFSSLRSTLSSYLGRPATVSVPKTVSVSSLNFSQLISSPSAIMNYLRHHALTDPLRFVSLLFTLFAISSWLRSKLLMRGSATTTRKASGSKLVGIKDMFKFGFSSLGQTIKMATKVTSL